jgi:uncharacterized protein
VSCDIVLGSRKLAIKSGDAFKGYASIFNAPHLDGSVVVPGCFKQVCPPVCLLLDHTQEHVVGRVDLIHEDHRGLYVEGVFTTNVPETKGGLSVGFEPLGEGEEGLRNAKLVEISLTEKPICPGAQITEIRRRVIGDFKYESDARGGKGTTWKSSALAEDGRGSKRGRFWDVRLIIGSSGDRSVGRSPAICTRKAI